MLSAGLRAHLARPWLLGVRLRRLSRSLSPRSRSFLAAAAGVACLGAAASLLDIVLFAAASSLFAARAGRAWGGSADHRLGVSSGWRARPRYAAAVGAEADARDAAPPLDWAAITVGGGGGGCRMRRPEAALALSYLTRAHRFVGVGGVAGAPAVLATRAAADQSVVVGVAAGADACAPSRGGGGDAGGGGGSPAVACAPSAAAKDLLAAVEGSDVAAAAAAGVDRLLVMGCGRSSAGGGAAAAAAARDELMGGLWRLLRPDSLVFYHGWAGAAAAAVDAGDGDDGGDDGEGGGPALPAWLARGCYTEVAAVVAAADGWGGLLVVRPTADFLAGRRVCAAAGGAEDAATAVAAADGDLPAAWSATAGRFDYRGWSLQRRLATAGARAILDAIAVSVLGAVVLAQRRVGLWGRGGEGRPALLGE